MPQEHEAKDSQLLDKIEKFQQTKFMVWFENNFIKIIFGVLIFYVFPLIFLSAFLNKQFQEQSALPYFSALLLAAYSYCLCYSGYYNFFFSLLPQ